MQQKTPSLELAELGTGHRFGQHPHLTLLPFLPHPSLPSSAPVHTRFASLYMAPQSSSLAQSNGATGTTTSVQVGRCSSLSGLSHPIAHTFQSSSEDPSIKQPRPCYHTPSFSADHRSCCFRNFRLCRPAVHQSRPRLNSVHTPNRLHEETTVHF